MPDNPIYKIIFHNHNKVYELFAAGVGSSDLYGFIEVSELQFDLEEGVVIDPTEDRLREEFADTEALFLPMHSVIRVEKVKQRGQCKIRDSKSGEKVTSLPLPAKQR